MVVKSENAVQLVIATLVNLALMPCILAGAITGFAYGIIS